MLPSSPMHSPAPKTWRTGGDFKQLTRSRGRTVWRNRQYFLPLLRVSWKVEEVLLLAEACKAGVEALDAAGAVHDALLARVERVRL